MICTTIQNKNAGEIAAILSSGKVEMAEIRLDNCKLSRDEIEDIFSGSDIPLVATCRISSLRTAMVESMECDRKTETKVLQVAESKLMTAIHAGAAYADIELDAPPMLSKRIRREATEYGTVLIRSFHDFSGADSIEGLKAVAEKCYAKGADIAKIAVTAVDGEDVGSRVLSLYDIFEPQRLIAFAMGETGTRTRIESLAKGAPFSYAALSDDDKAAPGQIPTEDMVREVYKGFRFVGEGSSPVNMPSSKSYAQRAIIAASLASGKSVLGGYTPCDDTDAAISAARALGAQVKVGISYNGAEKEKDGSSVEITGIGAHESCLSIKTLDTCESGLLTRLMLPLLSLLNKEDSFTVEGTGTLLRRPLKGVRQIMSSFGVNIENLESHSGSKGQSEDDVFVPLSSHGHLRSCDAVISGKDGSQLISGLAMALPLAGRDAEIRVTEPKSIPYVFMTADTMKLFGVKVWCDMEGGEEFRQSRDWNYCDALTLHVEGGQSYKSTAMMIEGDWSTAACFLVAGAVFGSVEVSGLDTKSLQADLSIMDILMEAGASISQDGEDDPKGNIHVRRAPLTPFDIDADNCPDLVPIAAVLAAFCEGESRISGIGRLSAKESDRTKAVFEMLEGLGVRVKYSADELRIKGLSLAHRILGDKMLHGGNFSSSHDHRMAMALAVASLGADSPVVIDDKECVAKSFPEFFSLFDSFSGRM